MKIINNFQLFLFMIFVFLWFISSKIPYLRYISIVIFGIFCMIQSIKILKRKKISVNNQIISYLMFALFSGLSFLWAIDVNLVLSKFFDLICNSIFLLMSYDFFINSNMDLKKILKIFMFIGFFFSIYVFFKYGISGYFTLLLAGRRVGSDIINVNFIGMVSSFTFIIALYMLYNSLFKHKSFGILVLIITLIISLGSGSKKVLLNIFLGVLLLFYFQFKSKITYKKLIKLVTAFVICFLVFSLIYKSSYFSTVFDRFKIMLDTFNDNSIDEGSTYVRIQMIQKGLLTFLKYPFFGIGINNARFILNMQFPYLHCNYVELLACTGIMGFILYYYIHIKTIIVASSNKNLYFHLVYIIILLILFSDLGVVSYYEIRNSLYLLLCFIINNKIDITTLNENGGGK